MHDSLFQLIQCPVTGQPLRPADAQTIARINAAIRNQQVRNSIDQLIKNEIDVALVNESSSLLYPVQNGVPWLMKDEAISLENIPPNVSETPDTNEEDNSDA